MRCKHKYSGPYWRRDLVRQVNVRVDICSRCHAIVSQGASNDKPRTVSVEMRAAEIIAGFEAAGVARMTHSEECGYDGSSLFSLTDSWQAGALARFATDDAARDAVDEFNSPVIAAMNSDTAAQSLYVDTQTRHDVAASVVRHTAWEVDGPVRDTADIDALIDRSSIGRGLANIRENGIDAELADLDEEMRMLPPDALDAPEPPPAVVEAIEKIAEAVACTRDDCWETGQCCDPDNCPSRTP